MKRFLSMLLVIIMMLTVLMVPAIAEGATEGEEDTGASITRTGDEEPEAVEPDDEAAEPDEEDDYIPADSILPTSTDRAIYLELSEDEETGRALYAKFPNSEDLFLEESEYDSAVTYNLDTGYTYVYASGVAADGYLADSDMENAAPILEDYLGVNAWLDAENGQACALMNVPGTEDSFLVMILKGDESEDLALEDLMRDEVERLEDGIELLDTDNQPAQADDEEITPNANVAVKSVKLSKSSQTLGVKGSFRLTATISPSNASNKKVTWTSSNSQIATVSSNGTVTGKKAGSCTITAKSNNGKTASCKVTVKKLPAVTKVVIAGSTYRTIIGGGYYCHAVCYPYDKPNNVADQTVTWSSGNPKIATVVKDSSGDGIIRATGYGTTTITATSVNGKKASITVTVERKNPFTRYYTVKSLAGVKLQDEMTVFVDGKTGKIVGVECSQIGKLSTGGELKGKVKIEDKIESFDIRVFRKEEHFVEFKSRWKVQGSKSASSKNVSAYTDMMTTYTYFYRLSDDGKLTFLRKTS